jgi:hypothetical protein
MPHLGGVWAHPPNPPMQLTPLRVRKIVAFLKRRIARTYSRSIGGGATDGQPVGPLRAIIIMPHCLIRYISKYIFSLHIQGIYES